MEGDYRADVGVVAGSGVGGGVEYVVAVEDDEDVV